MKFVKKMFGWKSKSKRKGITPVIAIVLLLMMTVAAAGMAYVWIMDLQEDIGEETKKDLANLNKQKNARLSVETVWNTSGGTSDGLISVMVKNAGSYAFSDDDAKAIRVIIGRDEVDHADGVAAGLGCYDEITTQGTTCTFISSAETFPIERGEVGQVIIKVVSPIGLGDTYVCSVPTDGSHHKSC